MSDPDAEHPFVIERTFDAPVGVVWQMWTVPEHFQSWYGPAGATVPVAKMDVRVSGSRLVCMEVEGPDGPMQMWFTGEYLEVVEERRLVYTEVLADEPGTPIAAGADAGAHEVTEVRVELSEVDGGTRMVMTHLGIPAGSPGEMGWTMAFDKLGTRLDSWLRSL